MNAKNFILLFCLLCFSQACKVKEITPSSTIIGTWYLVNVTNENLEIDCDVEKGLIVWTISENTITIKNNSDQTCPAGASSSGIPYELVEQNEQTYLGGANYLSGGLILDGNKLTLDHNLQLNTDLNGGGYVKRFEK